MKRRTNKEIEEKCVLLEKLGFVIEHADSRVRFNEQYFDFSSTACDEKSIVHTALIQMYNQAYDDGEEFIKRNMKKLLGIKEEQDD